MLQPLLTVAARYGVTPQLPVARASLRQPGPSIPIAAVFSVWADVAFATSDIALPLRAAAVIRLEELGAMGLASMTAASGKEALEVALRFFPLLASSGEWRSLEVEDRVEVSWLRGGDRCLGHRLANEYGAASFVACLRQVFGASFAPAEVSFRHRAPASVEAHRKFFGCRVEFGAATDGFAFPRGVLEQAPALSNLSLARHLAAEAEAALALRQDARLTPSVRLALQHELGRPAPDLGAARTARALGVSERTLRRRLRLEGTTFRALAGEAQLDAARHLLGHTGLSITDIALRVGYSDSAALAHATKRWLSCSPRELRRALLSQA